ncbi:hypothetical protein [Spirosoma fluviale]|uniref:Uncharacterized protein n=1 Tax=Spirosoma fluviale TaxID=1597977 RepID=A0A286GPZ5_9BACT|nr:hypothetical protein [Spirosoma fluviale]SOD97615.1 hypothetical protein SAMN06269250_5859 [Spirosoma fluviale]
MFEELPILRQAGFFKEYAELKDDELVNKIRQLRREEYAKIFEYEYEPEDFSHIGQLLAYDERKYLDIDLEADVMSENQVYVSVVERFSKASDNHFMPTDIQEAWQSDEGPIEVSFTCNGSRIVFKPKYHDDWLDGKVFTVINKEMQKKTDERFLICLGPNEEWWGQNVVHIRLSEIEKQLLEVKLGWVFPDSGSLLGS